MKSDAVCVEFAVAWFLCWEVFVCSADRVLDSLQVKNGGKEALKLRKKKVALI